MAGKTFEVKSEPTKIRTDSEWYQSFILLRDFTEKETQTENESRKVILEFMALQFGCFDFEFSTSSEIFNQF